MSSKALSRVARTRAKARVSVNAKQQQEQGGGQQGGGEQGTEQGSGQQGGGEQQGGGGQGADQGGGQQGGEQQGGEDRWSLPQDVSGDQGGGQQGGDQGGNQGGDNKPPPRSRLHDMGEALPPEPVDHRAAARPPGDSRKRIRSRHPSPAVAAAVGERGPASRRRKAARIDSAGNRRRGDRGWRNRDPGSRRDHDRRGSRIVIALGTKNNLSVQIGCAGRRRRVFSTEPTTSRCRICRAAERGRSCIDGTETRSSPFATP